MKNKLKFAAMLTVLLVATSAFAQKIPQGIMTRAQDRINNLCQTVELDEATKQKVVDLTCRQLLAAADLQKQKNNNTMTEDEFTAANRKTMDEYWKEMALLIPKDQLAAFREWKRKPVAERNAAPK